MEQQVIDPSTLASAMLTFLRFRRGCRTAGRLLSTIRRDEETGMTTNEVTSLLCRDTAKSIRDFFHIVTNLFARKGQVNGLEKCLRWGAGSWMVNNGAMCR